MIRKPWSKRRTFTALEITAILYMYEAGHNLATVAKEYRSTAPTISNLIKANGGTVRPRGSKRRVIIPVVVFKKKKEDN